MRNSFDIRESAREEYNLAKQYLLPNETGVYAVETEKGFLVATNRRLLYLERRERKEIISFEIHWAYPYDRIQSISMKKEKAKVEYVYQECDGNIERFSKKKGQFELNPLSGWHFNAPKTEKSEKEVSLRKFTEHIRLMNEEVEIIKKSEEFAQEIPPARDFTYFDKLPNSIIENAIYEANAFLVKFLDSESLHPEISKLIGEDAAVFRSVYQKDGFGQLLLIGSTGIIYVGGKRGPYHIYSDTPILIRYSDFLSLKIQELTWTREDNLQILKGKWSPTIMTDQEKIQYPWLAQSENGPWILSDAMYWKSGSPPPVNYSTEKKVEKIPKVRYLF